MKCLFLFSHTLDQVEVFFPIIYTKYVINIHIVIRVHIQLAAVFQVEFYQLSKKRSLVAGLYLKYSIPSWLYCIIKDIWVARFI